MPVRVASAVWNGELRGGNGILKTESGVLDAPYSFGSRFEQETGTNPEELLGAAHAGCFSMALSKALTDGGAGVKRIQTTARVHLEKVREGFQIVIINLITAVNAEGITEEKFRDLAIEASRNCPVSRALSGVKIELESKLITS